MKFSQTCVRVSVCERERESKLLYVKARPRAGLEALAVWRCVTGYQQTMRLWGLELSCKNGRREGRM